MVRGINKSSIFEDDQDRARFVERLGQIVIEAKCSIYAWVLMSNHVHILFKSGRRDISWVMRRLLTWYAQHYNHRHNRSGHLFENRYKSILCDEDNYLLALVRYIHLNPIRATVVKNMEELEEYAWSGHQAIMGKIVYGWMDRDRVLAEFGKAERKSVEGYRRFVKEGMREGRNPTLTGGGLVRSAGGWSQVLALRRQGDKGEADERILGSGVFVEAVMREAEERQLRQTRLRRRRKSIEEIIREESKKWGVSSEELKKGSRRRQVSRARVEIAVRCKEELGLSGAEIARHLGVNTTSINRPLGRRNTG
jgi:REP element-mobilizing transposase RayT